MTVAGRGDESYDLVSLRVVHTCMDGHLFPKTLSRRSLPLRRGLIL
jgi:hypothetical protein